MLKEVDLAEYCTLREIWQKDPVMYARQRLGINPTSQQLRLFEAIRPRGAKVTVRAGHGVGKTNCTAGIMLWHLETSTYSRTIATAPSSSQLYTVLWAELAKTMRKSDEQSKKLDLPAELWVSNLFDITQDKLVDKGSPKEWFVIARTSRKETPDALQGFHASDIEIQADGTAKHLSDGGGLLFVIEEASGVPDAVFEVAEGALSSEGARLLMIGNPTKNTGFFARSHKDDRSLYTALHFSCKDSPLVPATYRESLVRKYGEKSNIVRVRADGEFPKQDDDVLISYELTEACIDREPKLPHSGNLVMGIDVARFGDDRTVFAVRQGNTALHVSFAAKQDTMATVGMAVNLLKTFKVDKICVDVGGLGAGVVDRLKELKYPVVGVDAGSKAPEHKKRPQDAQGMRMRDYLWLESKEALLANEVSFALLDRDISMDLSAELASVKYRFDSSGRIVVESKEDMKARGLRSPDLADSWNLTYSTGINRPIAINPQALSRWGVRPQAGQFNQMAGRR